ncbi:hypothetical protein B0H15DRAFT_902941 [Mycena belliarum]|uniref:Uncharacterized protein n=1 Tax=Mycena belliarum TaxID=1033014 RepID=A0AAD6UA16_9AGAR|nr:hypothetical protein B0H15DRAFT_902941 [Mycena belliae]
MQQNRLGLGLRASLPPYGQGTSMSAPAYQQQAQMHPQKQTTLFVGSISGGITDATLNALLTACGPIKSFKRLITPANKPQGFGFAEFEEPDGALRALALLNNVELPALEEGCANKSLLIKADEKTRAFLDMYASTRPLEPPAAAQAAKATIDAVVADVTRLAEASTSEKEKYVVAPHLHDLQEGDLPEMQRGQVISEIAQFRERAAKREREKLRQLQAQVMPAVQSGPKMREWGRPKEKEEVVPQAPQVSSREQGMGRGAQGYNKSVEFVREEREPKRQQTRTDEELESDRKEDRRRDEEVSFRDRERRYEPRERTRIMALERAIARQRATAEAEAREQIDMRARLEAWDDDESDELFYVDRARWRVVRMRNVAAERSADAASAAFEAEEAANLARESEAFLARQMGEMQALAEEQRRAGLLLDDGAPLRLNVSLPLPGKAGVEKKSGAVEGVFGAEEDEEEQARKRKVPLVKLDFSATEAGPEAERARLEGMKADVPKEREALFKAKVRWDGMTDGMIDRKFEPLVKRLMTQYLGDAEEAEELIMFVVEHLKDHKGPAKLVEGLEPVLEEEAAELTTAVWRQLIFESLAYNEGMHTDRIMVD